MKRRGFLALMGAAPVAAPRMLQEVAAATTADLGLAGLGVAAEAAQNSLPVGGWVGPTDVAGATARLARLALRTGAEHAFFERRVPVHSLDPDLASYRSMSLAARVAMQRARNYQRELEQEKGWLNAIIKGWTQ